MGYVNMKGSHGIETVDEYKGFKEGKMLVREYRLSDPTNHYYLSSRSTKDWKKRR